MAALSASDIDSVHAEVMELWSRSRTLVPITSPQLRSGIVIADLELDSAEISFATAIPAGPIRDWVVANPVRGREMFEIIEKKRKEVS